MTAIFKIANKSTAFLYIKNWKNAYIEIINKVGARRCSSSNYQSRCCSSDRKARHSCRCSRYHRREPPSARAFIPYNLRVTYFRFQRGRCFPGMHMLGSFAGKPPGEKIPRSPLKWLFSCLRAPADAPVRINRVAAADPIERPGTRAVGHVTTGVNHFPAFGLPVIITEVCRA